MADYRDEVPNFDVKDGNMVIEWSDGQRLCIPLRIFRINMAAAQTAIDEHDASKVEPIPLFRLTA